MMICMQRYQNYLGSNGCGREPWLVVRYLIKDLCLVDDIFMLNDFKRLVFSVGKLDYWFKETIKLIISETLLV